MTNTFKTHATTFWEAGYSVIPVLPESKKPAVPGWTGYCDNVPSDEKKQDWLQRHGECGIGLLLGGRVGGEFRIAAVDIDRDELVKSAQALIKSPSGKVGKKGVTLFVRVNVGDKLKSTTIRGVNGPAGDLLIGRKMTVLPPSVHPDTGEPYRYIGSPLLETAADDLPVLDGRLYGVLERLCTSVHLANIQAGEATHSPALSLVAELVAAKATDEEIVAIITAALPERYAGDTLDELPEMIASAREKGFGDGFLAEDDENIAGKLVKLCLRSGFQLFHDGAEPYASIPTKEGGCLTYPTNSSGFRTQVRYAWYRVTGKSAGSHSLGDAVATLEAQALFEGPELPVWNRIGKLEEDIFIDLGRKDGQAIRISRDGWTPVYQPDIKFRHAGGAFELPVPTGPGDVGALKDLLHLSDEQYFAVVAFLISSMHPTGPYFALLIEGEQGSGKSFLAWVLKSLIDPNAADRLRLPDNDRDLAIQAKQFRMLSYDNTSGMKAAISDALCIVATGGGMATRKLYTDEELAVISAARPFILNGISGFAKRPDLLERSIYLHLDSMPLEKRRTEEEMKAEFMAQRPSILAGLYNLVGHALAHLKETPAPAGVRMADAARFISAAEGGLGVEPGALIGVISGSQDALMVERINDDPLTQALRGVLYSGPFEGTIGQLFERIKSRNDVTNLPRTTALLSASIERLKPSLLKVGIRITVLPRSRAGKMVRIELLHPEDADAYARVGNRFAPF